MGCVGEGAGAAIFAGSVWPKAPENRPTDAVDANNMALLKRALVEALTRIVPPNTQAFALRGTTAVPYSVRQQRIPAGAGAHFHNGWAYHVTIFRPDFAPYQKLGFGVMLLC